MEQLLVVDQHDEPIAISFIRGTRLIDGYFLRACGGLVVDFQRRLILCHKRSDGKDRLSGSWVATFGGKAKPEEIPASTAVRELYEEYGVVRAPAQLELFGIIKSKARQQFEHIFLVSMSSTNEAPAFVDGEVDIAEWFSFQHVLDCFEDRNASWFEYGYERGAIAFCAAHR
jgi:8-oxo-dGTP pyrophosphatase MutT (NUDIX family)